MLPEQIISCDWGTSSLRLRLVSLAAEKLLERVSSDRGIAALAATWSSRNADSGKLIFFSDLLREQLTLLPRAVSPDVPMLISGMAASSIGLFELPYAEVPFSLSDPELVIKKFAPGELLPNPVYLISGLRTTDDVMRGEETLILGLRSFKTTPVLVILPGTHSKHAVIRDGRIVDFKTFMTGEMFAMLRAHSILRHSMPLTQPALNARAFARGITASEDRDLLHTLFGVRALALLGHLHADDAGDYLSGLLIGHELREAASFEGEVIIVADDELAKRYRLAIEAVRRGPVTLVAGEQACIAGHCLIAKKIFAGL